MARKREKLKHNKTKTTTESFINGEDDEEALAAAHHDQPNTMKLLAMLLAGLIIAITAVMKKYVIQPVPKEIYQFHLPFYQENLYMGFKPAKGQTEPQPISQNFEQHVEIVRNNLILNSTVLTKFELVRNSCRPKGGDNQRWKNTVEIHLKYGKKTEFGYLLQYNQQTGNIILQHSLYSNSRDYPSGHHVWVNGSYYGIKEKYPHRTYQCWVLMPTSNGFHRIVAVPYSLKRINSLWHRDTTEDRVLTVKRMSDDYNFELMIAKLNNTDMRQVWQLIPQLKSQFMQKPFETTFSNPFSKNKNSKVLYLDGNVLRFERFSKTTKKYQFQVIKNSMCPIGFVKIMASLNENFLLFTANENKFVNLEINRNDISQCWKYKKWSSPVARTAFIIQSAVKNNQSYKFVWTNSNNKLVLEKYSQGDGSQHFYEEIVQ